MSNYYISIWQTGGMPQILEEAGELGKRVPYEDIIITEYAKKALDK